MKYNSYLLLINNYKPQVVLLIQISKFYFLNIWNYILTPDLVLIFSKNSTIILSNISICIGVQTSKSRRSHHFYDESNHSYTNNSVTKYLSPCRKGKKILNNNSVNIDNKTLDEYLNIEDDHKSNGTEDFKFGSGYKARNTPNHTCLE